MKAKSIVAGALKPNPLQIDEDNINIYPADSNISMVKMHGKSAVTFGGTNETLTGPNVFNVGTGDYTISTWVYIPDGAASISPISKYIDSNNYFVLYIADNSGIVVMQWKVGGSTYDNLTVLTSSLTGDAWNHITITSDRSAGDGGIVLYINGTAATLTFNVSDTATTDNLNIDSSTSVGRYRMSGGYSYNTSNSKQADLRCYSKALSATEVATMHSESLIKGPNAAGLRNSLLHYWSFGDTKGDGESSDGFFEFFDLPSLRESYARGRGDDGQLANNPNADLSISTGWTVPGSVAGEWSISGGSFLGQANLNSMINTANVTIGGFYKVTYDGTFASTGSNSILVYVGTTASGQLDSSNGQHTHYAEANKTTGLTFTSAVTSGGNVTVDNIKMYRWDNGGFISRNMERTDFGKEEIPTNLF